MSANMDKISIVIKNYFSAECDVDTTIRQAYERGFRRGASACDALNMHIRELSDAYGKLNEEHVKLRELVYDMLEDEERGHNDDSTFYEHVERVNELGVEFRG